MSRAATRVGVGTRFRYDGESVEVVEMAATMAGNEVVLKDGHGRLLPLSLKELLFSDSWLEATARRMDTALGDVMLHFGFPVRHRAGNQFRGIPADWTIFLDERLAAAVAHATGTVPEAVTAMTLAHYDGRALHMSAGGRAVSRHVLWGRGGGSRFCPECLLATGGRWQLSWRLGFSFACTRHRRLLPALREGAAAAAPFRPVRPPA